MLEENPLPGDPGSTDGVGGGTSCAVRNLEYGHRSSAGPTAKLLNEKMCLELDEACTAWCGRGSGVGGARRGLDPQAVAERKVER